jgi:hypothetical protein
MKSDHRGKWVFGLLLGAWLLVTAWQIEEHHRVKEAAKTDLRYRSEEIANTVSAVIRAARFRGTVVQDRLEPVLRLLVTGRTNELVKSSGLISVTLLNTNGDPVVSPLAIQICFPVKFSPKANSGRTTTSLLFCLLRVQAYPKE